MSELLPSSQNEEIKYCVTAVIDLQGFSSHLEISGNDLRTNIGTAAVNRLQTLVDALVLMEKERSLCTIEYPLSYRFMRINDQVILTMDLPSLLMPGIGESKKDGISGEDITKHFDVEKYHSAEEFELACNARILGDVTDLIKFVGLVSRLHAYINRQEANGFFPGAKTVIATGYRRPFFSNDKEDYFGANFSFSNAYIAEKSLHGSKFFLDDNVAQLLCANKFAQNLLRYSCFIRHFPPFDPCSKGASIFSQDYEVVKSRPIEISLFRKTFNFRELNPNGLAYLQLIERLSEYLEGKKESKEASFFRHSFDLMKNGLSSQEFESGPESRISVLSDIEEDIRVFPEFVETGTSEILDKRNELSRQELFNSSLVFRNEIFK